MKFRNTIISSSVIGCTCWFDIRRKDCACCKGKASKVMQCGWPMHHYCYKKSERFVSISMQGG